MRTQNQSLLVILILLVNSAISFSADDDDGINPQLSLKTSLPFAKSLLVEKKYKSFLTQFVPPKVKARILTSTTI